MAVLTSKQILFSLYQTYPGGIFKISDRTYLAPTEKQLWDEISATYFEDYEYLGETFDCGDYALLFHAWVRQKQYKYKWPQPLAFGEAWGEHHSCNIAFLPGGDIRLIEPAADSLLPASHLAVDFVRL